MRIRNFIILVPSLFCFCSLEPLTVEQPLIICDQRISPAPLPNASRFGIFDTRLWSGYNSCLDTLSLLLGTRPAYILWFQQIDDKFPIAIVNQNASLGIKTVISLNLKSLRIDTRRNDTLLREIVAGTWDSTLSAYAQQAAAVNLPVYLRFGYEMNGDWFSWGQQPAEFIAAWNHAHRIFKQAETANVLWIFSPGVLYGTMSPEKDLLPYYPGDSVVDIAGLDGYNFGDWRDQWGYLHRRQSFRETFGASLEALTVFDKPIWITEVGSPSNERRPGWLDELCTFMDNNPCVETVLWFNAQKTGEPDFRLESDTESLAKMREWLKK